MRIELIGSIDYDKLKTELKNRNVKDIEGIISYINELEKFSRVNKVSTAGKLSRFPGDVFEILGISCDKTFDQNTKFVKKVLNMGHDSITDHDYLVFALKNVSAVIEQNIIAERFSSFTIKSRREVDFSNAGFYVPDFHDDNGKILEKNEQIKQEYINYMNTLFNSYSKFINVGTTKEDSRFILPYCYYSNIIMGVDAHTLKDMIIKFTKTHLSKIQELKEFGNRLYEIAKENIPYIIDEIDKVEYKDTDYVSDKIDEYLVNDSYDILDKTVLLNATSNIDDTILLASIMRRKQYTTEKAFKIYKEACNKYPNFKKELMKKITFESDKEELTQVNFQFQIPISFAVLTHLTRHRTHNILIPEFTDIDLTKYKIPPKVKSEYKDDFKKIFELNKKMRDYFKNNYGIRNEDLVYFTLSGNLVNVVVNMNGKTLEHILKLRECNKAQWEIRKIANDMHDEIRKLDESDIFSSVLGPTCETMNICNEKKECCGKIYALLNQK